MDDAQAWAGGAAVEIEFDELCVRRAFDETIAELFHEGAHLAEILVRDLAGELRQILAHQRRDDADLDPLIEIRGPRRKTKPHTLSEMDVVHGILTIHASTGGVYRA